MTADTTEYSTLRGEIAPRAITRIDACASYGDPSRNEVHLFKCVCSSSQFRKHGLSVTRRIVSSNVARFLAGCSEGVVRQAHPSLNCELTISK